MIETYLYNLGFAVVFIVIGYMMAAGRNKDKFKNIIEETISSTIDNLARDGYIQTKGNGADQEILKWFEREWNEKE